MDPLANSPIEGFAAVDVALHVERPIFTVLATAEGL
ncbi:hypothetical protein ABIB69_000724 [Bradyrhizobium sp. F1.2.6]